MERFQVLTDVRGHPDSLYLILSLTLIFSLTLLLWRLLRHPPSNEIISSSSDLFVACADSEFNLRFKQVLINDIGEDLKSLHGTEGRVPKKSP